jgi:hypothetical protein
VIRSSWTGLVPADFGTYTVADQDMAYAEGLPRNDEAFTLAAVNGFIGLGAPWAALLICGTRYGPVRLTVEAHDSQPDVEGEWSEVVECEFVSASGTLVVIDWNNQDVATLEGVLVPGPWGLRACARGRDEGNSREGTIDMDDEPVEDHLLQFWPGPHQPNVVLTTDAYGATMRGELS